MTLRMIVPMIENSTWMYDKLDEMLKIILLELNLVFIIKIKQSF